MRFYSNQTSMQSVEGSVPAEVNFFAKPYFFQDTNEKGELFFCYQTLVAVLVGYTIMGSTFGVMLFCAVRVTVALKNTPLSNKSRHMQIQLFKALLVQVRS